MEGFDDVIKEFLVESYENLDQLDRDLVALEDAPQDRDRLASIFRTMHTIKGTSGFLALSKLERIAHVGENLLVPLRDGELELNRDMVSGLLATVDAIRGILAHVESDGDEGEAEYEALAARLDALRTGSSFEACDAPDESVADEITDAAEPRCDVDPAEITATELVEEIVELVEACGADPELQRDVVEEVPAPPIAPRVPARPPTNTAVATKKPPSTRTSCESPEVSQVEVADRSNSLADSTVRIDVGLLDKLMNLVGELVLARNQVLQFSNTTDDQAMIAASQRLNLITTELQEGVMKTRMQPIRNAWSKLPRVVRDVAAACGKKVEVQMEGADTELDKTILEAIKDPLTHIVRNSVDHGIEAPEVRRAAGKSPVGTLCLRAYHEGGQVNIEIIDDGGGISIERVRAKAIEKGVVSREHGQAMSDREVTNLILLPGFSTAEKVTNVSGRGVGMDVVKTNIERISGTLEIHSVPGEGTTLRIKIPLTLAIVPALIVKSGHGRYAIPQVSLLELVRLDGTRVENEIEYIHDAPVYRLRGNLLPLVYLDEQLELRRRSPHDAPDENVNIVVLRAEDRQFGLVVDGVTDTQEIVVKPLGQHLKSIPAFAGSTIMGDGSVALILDVIGLAHRGNVLAERHDQSLAARTNRAQSECLSDHQLLLVVDPGDGSRVAVRLSTVARLEEFKQSDIERTGHSEVVQYRDRIMPLLRLNSGGYGSAMDDEDQRLQVVVYQHGQQSIGIVVGQIIDIVQQELGDEGGSSLPGRHVVQGRVTELVDLEALVRSTCPGVFDTTAA